MGGWGSGRYGGAPTAEGTASYVFSAKLLGTVLRKGPSVTGTVYFGEEEFPVKVTIDTSDLGHPFLELAHAPRDDREPDRTVRDRIDLIWTVPTYGGRRWWFICPRTRRRASKLYLPLGGWHFWSRAGYGLGYACQRADRFGRLQRKAMKLHRQLGGEGGEHWNEPPPKPKWMRWATYDRKYEAWNHAVERADMAFVEIARRLLPLV